jgi:hypothetical protein
MMTRGSKPTKILRYLCAPNAKEDSFEYELAAELETDTRAAYCYKVQGRHWVTDIKGATFTDIVRCMLANSSKMTPPNQEDIDASYGYVDLHIRELHQYRPELQGKVNGRHHY